MSRIAADVGHVQLPRCKNKLKEGGPPREGGFPLEIVELPGRCSFELKPTRDTSCMCTSRMGEGESVLLGLATRNFRSERARRKLDSFLQPRLIRPIKETFRISESPVKR